MLISLPLVAYLFLLLNFHARGFDRRESALFAATVWGFLVAVITELLSLLGSISLVGLAGAWSIVALFSLILWRRCQVSRLLVAQKEPESTTDAQIALLVGSGMLVLVIGVVAVGSPPNTWDAMVYHMPRVAMWAMNESVEFYPTFQYQQLFMPPWAEYAMLHTYVLSGGDRYVNLVQWFALLGSALGVSAIARCLGAGVRGQVFAAIVCVTIPQGILEASGAKNDYVVALWLVLFVYFLLRFREQQNWTLTLGMGAALGLAFFTKGTAYVFVPALFLALFFALPQSTRRLLLRRVPVVLVVVLVINGPQYVRNFRLSGSPLGSFDSFWGGAADWNGTHRFSNDRISATTTISNVLRNVALHIATPSEHLNQRLQRWVERTLSAMGADPNDPASTWYGATFRIPERSKNEALAGNTFHLGLLTLALAWVFWPSFLRGNRDAGLYAVGLLGAFLFFCTLFRWQPWHARLHLPLFVLGAALIGVLLARVMPGFIGYATVVLLLMLAAPYALENQIRPLLYSGSIFNTSRSDLYFSDRRNLNGAYTAAAAAVRNEGCNAIGIDSSHQSYVYPLLALFDLGRAGKKVQFVGVENRSAVYHVSTSPTPCVIICSGCAVKPERWEKYESAGATASFFGDTVVISLADSTTAQAQGSSCRAWFGTGWYPREVKGRDWWYWSANRGVLGVFAMEATTATLRSEFMSQPMPNVVEIWVNGRKEMDWPVAQQMEITLQLARGENEIEFVSGRPAMDLPNDPRSLAIGLKNSSLSVGDFAAECEIAF